MPANDRQIGGDHYKTPYEHWDLVIKVGMGYLDGCSTKHVSRWRKKLGLQDLQKGMHYLEKLIENATYDNKRPNIRIDVEVARFVEANGLNYMEYQFIFILSTYRNEKDLKSARQILSKLMNNALVIESTVIKEEELNRPGTPDDGGHHAGNN